MVTCGRNLLVFIMFILVSASCTKSGSSKNGDPTPSSDPGVMPPPPPLSGNSKCKNFVNKIFGDHVCVFDNPSKSTDIQGVLDDIHDNLRVKTSQFTSEGYALLFHKGDYPVTARIGYYTQLLGLGKSPKDNIFIGVRVDENDYIDNTSLQNFWRSAENFTVPGDGDVWAVSQAAPLRRSNIEGTLLLAMGDKHYASGGFISNSLAGKHDHPSGQQQWLTRSSTISGWEGGVWNMVFVGTEGAPAGSIDYGSKNSEEWNQFPITTLDKTPRIQEKPYLIYNDDKKEYQIIVPKLKVSGSSGVDWADEDATVIPQDHIKILNQNMNASEINKYLKGGSAKAPIAIIFTPGIYKLDETLEVQGENTVILGLGVPVLSAIKPHISIMQTKARGVKIGGIIFEAGSNESFDNADPSLLEIGEKGNNLGDANSPSALYDVYCRIGGRVPGQTKSCITIYDDYTIGDNFWLWRADHGGDSPERWDTYKSDHGLLVYGDNVTIYGLAVEHFQDNQVIWSGENGEVYFYQSELPYDVPDGEKIAASFKIVNDVKRFKGYGFGIYDYFRKGKGAFAESAIETPNNSGISFTNTVTKVLNYEVENDHIKSILKLTANMGDNPTVGKSNASNKVWNKDTNKFDYPPCKYGYWQGTTN